MGYSQITTGVTTSGVLPPLVFSSPICAQYSIQVTGAGASTAYILISVDGVNFIGSGITLTGTGIAGGPSPQNLKPILAIQADVVVSGAVDVAIAAAPLNSE
jgi:hypothetical protein